MTKWRESKLIKEGYEIRNALITRVDLSMAAYSCLTLELTLEGDGWGCVYGGYVLGKGYIGADDDFWKGSARGMESIMRIMDIVDCERFNDLKGKYVRVSTKGWGECVKIIGNITKDKWFDEETFFAEDQKGVNLDND